MQEKEIITIRVDRETKEEAAELFDTLGLPLSTAINIFLRQCVREKRIPFDIFADSSAKSERKTTAGPGRKPKALYKTK